MVLNLGTSTMLRISKLTDYAIIVLCRMAQNPECTHTASDLSSAVGLAVPTVSKVLKLSSRAGIVHSSRGSKGGYYLSGAPESISIAAIIRALEGPIALTECGLEHDTCEKASSCQAKGHWHVINRAIQTALDAITLADLSTPPGPNGGLTSSTVFPLKLLLE